MKGEGGMEAGRRERHAGREKQDKEWFRAGFEGGEQNRDWRDGGCSDEPGRKMG